MFIGGLSWQTSPGNVQSIVRFLLLLLLLRNIISIMKKKYNYISSRNEYRFAEMYNLFLCSNVEHHVRAFHIQRRVVFVQRTLWLPNEIVNARPSRVASIIILYDCCI